MTILFLLMALELDQQGKVHQLGAWPDQVFVLDFAASWCAPCKKVLPQLQKIKDNHPNWTIWVVSVDQTESGRDRLVKQLNLRLPVIWDKDHAWAAYFNPPAMPTTMVVNADGKILASHSGYRNDLESFLATWLER